MCSNSFISLDYYRLLYFNKKNGNINSKLYFMALFLIHQRRGHKTAATNFEISSGYKKEKWEKEKKKYNQKGWIFTTRNLVKRNSFKQIIPAAAH